MSRPARRAHALPGGAVAGRPAAGAEQQAASSKPALWTLCIGNRSGRTVGYRGVVVEGTLTGSQQPEALGAVRNPLPSA